MDKLHTLLVGLLTALIVLLFVAGWVAPFAADYYILYISDYSWFIKIPAVCLTTVCQLGLYAGMGELLGDEEA